jgi:hypothetical protein
MSNHVEIEPVKEDVEKSNQEGAKDEKENEEP